MRKSFKCLAASAIGAVGLMIGHAQTASASIFTAPFDTIYSDTFAAPAVNVNAASADPNAIVGNTPAVSTGLDGGTAAATYLSTPVSSGASGNPDADWVYSGSNSATITSPAVNVVTGEDTKTIANLTLPFVPVVGEMYDFEVTMTAAAATGGHGLEMAYLFNGGNGHNASEQAISNNDPLGLILDRDANAAANDYFEIFENTGTGSDNSFAPTSSALTGGSPGTAITVDEVYTPTSTTTGSESVYLNGVLAGTFSLTGLTGGISDIQFGDNRDASGTFANFSLTAVPEPASLSLLAIGGLLAARRRRAGM